MDRVLIACVFVIGISRKCFGLPVLTCNDVNPTSTLTAHCFCYNPGGLGLIWHRDSTYLTQCTESNELCFNSVGYTFTVNSSASIYTIDIGSYTYTDCSNVSCSDSTTPSDTDVKTISVDESSYTPSILQVVEPTNHTNGNITFTTDCLYKAHSSNIVVTAKWTAVTSGNDEHVLDVDETAGISAIGSCQSCSNDYASKYSINYYHKEDQSENKVEAHIRLQLLLGGIPLASLNQTTNNMYYVRVDIQQPSSSWCIIFENEVWCIFIIVLGIVIFLVLVVLVCCCCWKHKGKTECKTVCCCCVLISGCLVWIFDRKKVKAHFKVVTTTKNSIVVQWKRCDVKEGQLKYELTYSDSDSVITIPITDNVEGSYMNATIDNLSSSTYYTLDLACIEVDSDRILKKYDPIKERTHGVPEAPRDFQVKKGSISSTSMMVTWVPMFDGGRPQTFVLTCSGEGYNNLPKQIEDKGKSFMFHTFNGLSDGTYYNLELRSQNENGLSERLQPLRERTLGKPDPPEKLSFDDVTENSMTVKWNKGFNGGYPQWFTVLNFNNKQNMSENILEGDQPQHQLRLTALTQSTNYKLKVIAKNKIGPTESLDTMSTRTKGTPDPPTNLKSGHITISSIIVNWEKGFNGGYPQCFHVYDLNSKKTISKEIQESEDKNKKIFSYNLTNLEQSTTYTLQILAKNSVGSVYSKSLDVRTNGKPCLPTNFKWKSNSNTSITVQWNAGLDGGYKQHFVVSIFSGENLVETDDTINDDGSGKPFSKKWKNLKESTSYKITLFAKNQAGESETLKPLCITTYAKPDPPREFEVAENGVTNDTIKVQWFPGFSDFEQTFYVKVNEEEHKVQSGVLEYVCRNLEQGKFYTISLRAQSKYGSVCGSDKPLHVRTFGPPDTPTEFRFVKKTKKTITMKWKPGNCGGSEQHFILVDTISGQNLAERIPDASDAVEHTITKLKEWTDYKLQVLAKNAFGKSLPSSEVDVKTKGSPFESSSADHN